jgi:hypothetical protein
MLLARFFLGVLTLQIYAIPGCWGDSTSTDDVENYHEKYALFTRFADTFMYPNNTNQAEAVNSTLFSETVQGRVDATTTFAGRELNTEVYSPLTFC